jgi:hypothetical protein
MIQVAQFDTEAEQRINRAQVRSCQLSYLVDDVGELLDQVVKLRRREGAHERVHFGLKPREHIAQVPLVFRRIEK